VPVGIGEARQANLTGYGLWGRDERSALRWLARSAGAACQVVYLPVDKDVQLARIAHRQETAPHQTFPMSEADVDAWREQVTRRILDRRLANNFAVSLPGYHPCQQLPNYV
jgi:predicted kinase